MTSKLPKPAEMLRELVALPSVSSRFAAVDQSNRQVIERIANWAEDVGFEVVITPLANQPTKANLVATLGSGAGGLVLSGHTDTVPYDQLRWASDPFRLVERDGKLFGLGAADMKAFFPVAFHVAQRFNRRELKEPLIVVATADEESTMEGARQLSQARGVQARAAFIGEPTGLVPLRAHKGTFSERIHLTGRSGHSSNPLLGESALDGMHQVMDAIRSWRQDLAQRRRDADFEVPSPTLNFGRIAGGDSPNRICAVCELDFDVRVLPGMSLDEVRADLHARVRGAVGDRKLEVRIEPLAPGTPPFCAKSESAALRVAEAVTESKAQTAAFCTEAPYFASLGIDTTVLGPGDISVAHQPNEFVRASDLERAQTMYERIVNHFCLEGAS